VEIRRVVDGGQSYSLHTVPHGHLESCFQTDIDMQALQCGPAMLLPEALVVGTHALLMPQHGQFD